MQRPASALTLATTVALASLAAACNKDSIEKHEVAKETQAQLGFLPKSTQIVFGLSLAKARTTELYKKYVPDLLKTLPPELEQMKQACGIDLVNDIDTVIASLGANLEDERGTLVVIKGKITKDKVSKCLNDLGAKAGGTMSATDQGKLTVYSAKGESKSAYAYWAAPDTVVISPAAYDDPKALDPAIAAGGPDARLLSMIENVDTTGVAWGAGNIPEQARAQMTQMGYVPDGFFLSLDAKSDLDLALGLRYPDDKSAESSFKLFKLALDQTKQQPPMPELKTLLDAVKIDHGGKDVKLSAHITIAQIEQLMGMLGGLAL